MASLGTKIRLRRQELGLSQQKLLAGGYSEAYLSRVERDQMQPSQDFLMYLAEQLGLPITDLIEEISDKADASGKYSKEEQEWVLNNAATALQKKEYAKVQDFLGQLDARELSGGLLAQYYYILGDLEVEQKDFRAAESDLKQALVLYGEYPRATTFDLGKVRYSLGKLYYRQNNHDAAIREHRLCREAILNGEITDHYFKLQVYYSLANEHHATGDNDLALSFYQEASKIADKAENISELAGIYWGLALTYRSTNNMSAAKLYLDKSAVLYESLAELELASTVKGILGIAMVERQEYAQAEEALQTALHIAQQLADSSLIAKSYTNLAYLKLAQREFESAEQYAKLGIEKASEGQQLLQASQALAQLADVKVAQGDFEEAFKFFEEALQTVEKTGALEYIKRIFFRYATALEKAGEILQAMQMYKKSSEYQIKNQSNFLD